MAQDVLLEDNGLSWELETALGSCCGLPCWPSVGAGAETMAGSKVARISRGRSKTAGEINQRGLSKQAVLQSP